MPRAPEPAAPFRFPFVATFAPVVVSVALWLVTGSMFALLFAALGPVTAVASVVDSRLGSRRGARRERARFLDDVERARTAIREQHAVETSVLDEETPDAAAIVARRSLDPGRWHGTQPLITVGRARRSSATRLSPRSLSARVDDEIERALDDLESMAATLDNAAITVDASLGIGVFGPPALALAAARSYALQLAWSLSPAYHWASAVFPEPEHWVAALPHPEGRCPSGGRRFEFGVAGTPDALAVIAVAATAAELPGSCRIVIRVGGDGGASIVQHPDRELRQAVTPTFVSSEDARRWAIDAARDATRHGLTPPHAAVPLAAELTPLLPLADSDPPPGLAARVALSADGPMSLDLVADGPHAVVGGTTGSGKSELLIAWVLAMAAAHSPERVTFLLVDFKGGSAFGNLADLPHTVGTITDLDARGAARALASLRAELAHRERTLAAAAARSIDEFAVLARLVIVVDEFAAMLDEHPDLHSLFADLAARGRSLGVHLILCTQRPAGVVRDGVLANADLRVSLRVNNASDSTAVVGTHDAARIPADARGRAIVRRAGGEPELVQFALATPADAASIAQRWPGAAKPRRPWMQPLPSIVRTVHPVTDGTAFGLLDLPAEQRWGTAVWRERDGNVVVLGAPGTGKTAALRALGGPNAVWLPESVDAAWDAVADLASALDAAPRATTVVADDLDAVLARFSPDHRAVVVERLARVLREGGSRGIRMAIAAQRLSSDVQLLAGLIPSRLWLRHASRHDLVLAGGDGSTHDDRLPPGAGHWRGDRVQVVLTEPRRELARPARETAVAAHENVAIVSSRAGWLTQRLGLRRRVAALSGSANDIAQFFASNPGVALIGDVDDWQSRWGALAAARPVAGILFHGCTPADFRALTRSRELPPPASRDSAVCWRLEPDGAVTRARLPI